MIVISEKTWGVELKDKKEHFWNPSEDTDGEEDQKLLVGQAALGVGARNGERNIVQVSYTDDDGKKHQHIILSLKCGLLEQCSLNLGFTGAVSFQLVEGIGPVHIIGTHVIAIPDMGDEDELLSDEELEDEEDEDEDERETKLQTLKNTIQNGSLANKRKVTFSLDDKSEAKKQKLQNMVDDEAEESDGEDNDSDDFDDDEFDQGDSVGDSEDGEDDDDNEMQSMPGKKSNIKVIDLKKAKDGKQKQLQPQQGKVQKPQENKSVDEIVKELKANPQRPKNQGKLAKFLRGRYNVTDEKKVNQIWQKLSN